MNLWFFSACKEVLTGAPPWLAITILLAWLLSKRSISLKITVGNSNSRQKRAKHWKLPSYNVTSSRIEIELTEREDGFTLSYSESQPAAAKVNIKTLEITDLPEDTLLYSINWQVWRVFSPVLVRVAIFTYEFSNDKLLTNAVSKDLDDIASCLMSLEFQN